MIVIWDEHKFYSLSLSLSFLTASCWISHRKYPLTSETFSWVISQIQRKTIERSMARHIRMKMCFVTILYDDCAILFTLSTGYNKYKWRGSSYAASVMICVWKVKIVPSYRHQHREYFASYFFLDSLSFQWNHTHDKLGEFMHMAVLPCTKPW